RALVLLGNDPVPAQGSLHRFLFGPDSGHPYRYPRLLHWHWNHRQLVDLIMRTAEAERLSAPQSGQYGERLVHDLCAHLEVHFLSYFVKSSVIFRGAEPDP